VQRQDLTSGEGGVADFTVFLQVAMTVGKAAYGVDSLDDV